MTRHTALNILGIEQANKNISAIDLVTLIQLGFTKQNYINVKNAIGLSHELMASILSTNVKALKKCSKKHHLDDKISERLLMLAEVIALGDTAFGHPEIFHDWIKRPLLPLDGKRPIDLMVNSYGLEMIKNLIGRIEHSTYS